MHGAHVVRMHCMHVRMSRSATLRIALRGHEVISTCMQVLRSAVIVAGAVAWGSGLACMHSATRQCGGTDRGMHMHGTTCTCSRLMAWSATALSARIFATSTVIHCRQETDHHDDCGSSQRGQSSASAYVLRAPSASTRTCPLATCTHTTATLIRTLATVVVSIVWLRDQHACSTCVCVFTSGLCMRRNIAVNLWQKTKKNKIGHHARPRRASATAPLRTGADTCKTGSDAGKRAGAKSDSVRRRSTNAWTEDQAGKRKCANMDAVGGWRVHTADDTASRSAATRSKHCNLMCQGDIWPRAAAGSSRNETTQAVAATTGIRLAGNAASNTASAWSDPDHTRKRSSRRRASATELSRPGIHWLSNSRCSMWRHLCSLAA